VKFVHGKKLSDSITFLHRKPSLFTLLIFFSHH